MSPAQTSVENTMETIHPRLLLLMTRIFPTEYGLESNQALQVMQKYSVLKHPPLVFKIKIAWWWMFIFGNTYDVF